MQSSILAALTIVATGWVRVTFAADSAANPLGQALSLLGGLAEEVKADGEQADKDFKDYLNWCDTTAKNIQNEIKTATAQKGKLEASIAEFSSAVDVSTAEISELAGAIAEVSQRLEKAAAMREKEHADFADAEKELAEVVETVGRAIAVLEREMEKSPAAFAQLGASGGRLAGVLQALSVITDAAGFTNADHKRLTALVQTQEDDEDDDDEEPAAHKSQSGGIVEVLEDMKEKAEAQLSALRMGETKSRQEYELLKQSLEDGSAADKRDLANQKAALAEAQEGLAGSQGELEVTTKNLKESTKEITVATKTCMTVAADHELSIAARDEELKVIAEATTVIEESQGGAASFLQVASRSVGRSTSTQVAKLVAQLARTHHSAALAQLSSRITAATRYGTNGGSPFDKVSTLIVDMISKLEKEASEEASEKAFCDQEQGSTDQKKGDLQDDVAKLKAKTDQAAAKSAELKEQVTVIQAELAEIAKAKASVDQIRQAGNADYIKTKADLQKGLSGVRKAIDVLRDYYASKDDSGAAALLQDSTDESNIMQQPEPPKKFEKAGGAGTSIIGILEVIESDTAKDLTAIETEESGAEAEYDKQTQEFKLATTEKMQAVKFKTQEFKGLDKSISEHESDLGTVNSQLDDVLEYDAQLKDRCVAKVDSYEETKARRDAEIAGLKQAMTVLEGEGAFVQKRSARHTRRELRGSL